MPQVDTQRFAGFTELYHNARPVPPPKLPEILLGYLRRPRAGTVVDLGSGTGLSTAAWSGYADRIVGIEPTADMRRQAASRYPDLEFLDATSYATGLPDQGADVVVCSQSFHWMEPSATLAEVARILRPEGVFAVLDCLWPVSWDWEAEKAYNELITQVGVLTAAHLKPDAGEVRYPKSAHRANIEGLGRFRLTAEVLFDNEEPCGPDRFIALARSQGQLQKLLKHGVTEIEAPLAAFERVCRRAQAASMRVSYRMIVAVR